MKPNNGEQHLSIVWFSFSLFSGALTLLQNFRKKTKLNDLNTTPEKERMNVVKKFRANENEEMLCATQKFCNYTKILKRQAKGTRRESQKI